MRFGRQPAAQLTVTLSELRLTLAGGWVIDPPVYRKQLPGRLAGPWYCDVILWREGELKVLTLMEDEALRSFLAEQGMTVEPL